MLERKKKRLSIPSKSVLIQAEGERRGKKVRPSLKWTKGKKVDGFWEVVGEFASGTPEFHDVAWLLGVEPGIVPSRSLPSNDNDTSDVLAQDSFLPPVVASLVGLATADVVDNPRKADREFERRVGHAFKVIGLDVDYLGGQNEADGIARTLTEPSRSSWVVIFDAKRWTDGFRLTKDEERKMKDYVRKHGDELRNQYQNRFFALVGNAFRDRDVEKAVEVRHELGDAVQQVVFIEIAALVRVVERRLSEGAKEYDLSTIGKLMKTGVLREADVE